MNNKKLTPPEKHEEFFNEIAKVFQRYPDLNIEYSISKRTSENSSLLGCCEYCVDDNGNVFCCISGTDCTG